MTTPETLLASLDDGDIMYDRPVSMSGEPMDPVLFVRWEAVVAALTPTTPALATYELWDRETANIIGAYATVSEVLATVVGLIQANPDMRAEDLLVLTPTTPERECDTCGGDGWVLGIDADPLPSGEPGEPYQTQDTCPDCGGGGLTPTTPATGRTLMTDDEYHEFIRYHAGPMADTPERPANFNRQGADMNKPMRVVSRDFPASE